MLVIPERVDHALAVLGVDHLPGRSSGLLLRVDSQDSRDGRALIADHAVRVDDRDDVARLFDEGAEVRLALAEAPSDGCRCAVAAVPSGVSFELFNPPVLGEPKGFNHGLAWSGEGRVLFVAGQTATGLDGTVVGGGFAPQFTRCLDRVLTVVEAAGGGPENIGRMTIFVTDMSAYRASLREIGDAYRERMGRHFPAMALVAVTELVDHGAMVEIEATAIVP